MTNREVFDLALRYATEFIKDTSVEFLYKLGVCNINYAKISTFPHSIHVGIQDIDTDISFLEWGKKESSSTMGIEFESSLYSYLVYMNQDDKSLKIYKTGIIECREVKYDRS